jgi:ABC-type glycerol-3-phosphate transport system permease component
MLKRVKRKIKKITLKKTLLYVILFALVAFTGLPIIYMISTAFKPLHELFLWPPRFFVRNPTVTNFSDLMVALSSSDVPFTRYVFNSVFVTATTVTCTVIVCSMGAYGLVKHKPPGSAVYFNVIVAALMFSPHVTRIPSFMVINSLGLVNTYWALILPSIPVAYNFFLMKQFLEPFPNDLLEAARIDGANELHIYWKIVMPALTPAWSTLVVFSFVSNWNDFMSPLIYIHNQAMKTLPLALRTIGGGGSIELGRAGAVAAATLLMTLPTIIIFTIMQSRVMETMTYSGIKG